MRNTVSCRDRRSKYLHFLGYACLFGGVIATKLKAFGPFMVGIGTSLGASNSARICSSVGGAGPTRFAGGRSGGVLLACALLLRRACSARMARRSVAPGLVRDITHCSNVGCRRCPMAALLRV